MAGTGALGDDFSQTLIEESGDAGAMTVVYAVQDGDGLRIETESVRSEDAAADVIADVQDEPDVLAVEVDAPRQLTGLPLAPPLSADPGRTEQWGLDDLTAETAWTSATGAGVTVAVIDSGVSQHPDLGGAFVKGTDLVDGTNGRVDLNGHGTHVAGIIAMTPNNNIGGAGLAPDVAIMPVVVADASGSVRASDSARGIVWAVDHGADILNMSYSGSASSVEQKAIQYAQSKGVITVAAVGNAYLDSGGSVYNPVQYPAAFPGVLGVGAVTRTGQRSAFSEVGKQVDIVAPGGSGVFDSSKGIYSTFTGSSYVRMPGTSMAAPFVTAAAALAVSRERALGIDVDTEDLLLGTATDLGAQGRDDEFGFGRVNPVAALDTVAALAATGGQIPAVTLRGDHTDRPEDPCGRARGIPALPHPREGSVHRRLGAVQETEVVGPGQVQRQAQGAQVVQRAHLDTGDEGADPGDPVRLGQDRPDLDLADLPHAGALNAPGR